MAIRWRKRGEVMPIKCVWNQKASLQHWSRNVGPSMERPYCVYSLALKWRGEYLFMYCNSGQYEECPYCDLEE